MSIRKWTEEMREGFGRRQFFREAAAGEALLVGIGWLCFASLPWALAMTAGLPFYLRFRLQQHRRQAYGAMQREFRAVMAGLYSLTAAGDSLERALRETREDMRRLEDRYPCLLPAFDRICIRMDQNVPADRAFYEFAAGSGSEEILQFARVLSVAARSGGSLSEIIRQTSETMALRMDVNEEIETAVSGRKGEFYVMMAVPPGILLYMNLCSPDYMTILYHTLIGRGVMVLAIALYLLAVRLGKRILDIRV